jgi:hypothetical protein
MADQQNNDRTAVALQLLLEEISLIVPPNPAMDLAQRIINNPNLNLKYENTKIMDFFGELAKDTITAINFITRVDKCQSANNWSDTTTYYNFSLVLQGTTNQYL